MQQQQDCQETQTTRVMCRRQEHLNQQRQKVSQSLHARVLGGWNEPCCVSFCHAQSAPVCALLVHTTAAHGAVERHGPMLVTFNGLHAIANLFLPLQL
jgi:hypothetical protein